MVPRIRSNFELHSRPTYLAARGIIKRDSNLFHVRNRYLRQIHGRKNRNRFHPCPRLGRPPIPAAPRTCAPPLSWRVGFVTLPLPPSSTPLDQYETQASHSFVPHNLNPSSPTRFERLHQVVDLRLPRPTAVVLVNQSAPTVRACHTCTSI